MSKAKCFSSLSFPKTFGYAIVCNDGFRTYSESRLSTV